MPKPCNCTPLTKEQQTLVVEFLPEALRIAGIAKRRALDRRWDDEYDSEAALAVILAVRGYDPAVGNSLYNYVIKSVIHAMRLVRRRLGRPSLRPGRVAAARAAPPAAPLQSAPAQPGHEPGAFTDLLTGLSQQGRSDLTNHFLLGKSIAEMARAERAAKQSVHYRINVALTKLRNRHEPS